ncbi:flagellar biosynthesis regulator FlaF [Devosia sp. RR2S18]|jgi:flagellar protein FlaF|uniref:flagellar biosynthesis regulator FlaF n=1 Tax=Devosia rhizosphaerae TaxID=3049774 RepID=UPI00254026AF|nr:flagellar biosynthesis regulator FlaF [Devosia sp. RR2S18]WIJ26650.1 flagellar biosynthesis regulator FlaF [Devosia sp. RR2S18]
MHQQGAQAYQQTAKVVESPRERESALLMKAAAGLQKVRDNWPDSYEDLKPALTFNRKLWTIFMASVTKEDSHLPTEVRQNIANLGMFIMNQTREINLTPDPQPEQIEVLVRLNRQIAAGLRGM